MADRNDLIENRLARIERMNRILTGITSMTGLLLCSAILAASSQSVPAQEPLRQGPDHRDSSGRQNHDRRAHRDRNTGNPDGLIINDAAGAERRASDFRSPESLSWASTRLLERDDRNRERITCADENGGSYIRFLDRQTSVPARLYLDDQNQVWLEFTGTQGSQIVRRRIGLGGDETTRTPR